MTTVPDASQSLLDVIKTNDLLAVRQHITIGGASVDEDNCLLYSIAHDLQDIAFLDLGRFGGLFGVDF